MNWKQIQQENIQRENSRIAREEANRRAILERLATELGGRHHEEMNVAQE